MAKDHHCKKKSAPKRRKAIAGLFVLALSGAVGIACSPKVETLPAETKTEYELRIFLSNQSSLAREVDLRVYLDHVMVWEKSLPGRSEHVHHPKSVLVEEGAHVLRVESSVGAAFAEQRFIAQSPVFATVSFWHELFVERYKNPFLVVEVDTKEPVFQ